MSETEALRRPEMTVTIEAIGKFNPECVFRRNAISD